MSLGTMPGLFSRSDPADYVQGLTGRFDVPDLATLDRHLTTLAGRRLIALSAPTLTPQGRKTLKRNVQADIDALLDRRLWFMLTQEEVG